MDIYNLFIDIKNYIANNKRLLIALNIILACFVIVGLIIGCSVDCFTLREESGNATFKFINGESNTFILGLFFGVVVEFFLLFFSRCNKYAKIVAYLVVCVRAIIVFRRIAILFVCYGVFLVFPIILLTLLEIAVLLVLQAYYLLGLSQNCVCSLRKNADLYLEVNWLSVLVLLIIGQWIVFGIIAVLC